MKLSKRVNLRIKKSVGSLVLFSQVFSMLLPLATFAAPQAVSGGDIQNALETVGTKANRLKTVGSSGVDESSGAFTYSYPFSLPKGLLGLEPSITLAYNSQSTENSTVGYGWNMAIPYIERTSKYGVDKIYTKNDFVSSLGGELILKSNTTNQYIQKIDDGSYQEYTLANNIFTLKDRSGNIYTYGQTVDSRLSDTTGTKIQKYFLTEVRDIMGNKIKYFYEKKNGFVYPKEIVYTVKKDGTYSNKIVLEREDRLDKEISYKSGFRTEMTDRIKTVRAYTDNVEVAKLELTYVTGQNGTRSLLEKVKESRVGTDNVWTTIPETKFEYEKTAFTSVVPNLAHNVGHGYMDVTGDAKPEYFNLTNGVPTGASWKVMDIDGDYRPDMFYHLSKQTYCNGYCGSNWLPAEGLIKFGLENGSQLSLGMDKINTLSIPPTADYHWQYRGVDNNSVFTDLNGDGLQDIVNSSIYVNNGTKFASSTLKNSSGYNTFADVNGDGLADKITSKEVYLNNGEGWSTATETKHVVPFVFQVNFDGGTFDTGVRFVDVNGDGLVDMVRSYRVKTFYGWGGGGNNSTANDVYLNNGSEWVYSNLKVSKFLVDSDYYIPPTGTPQFTEVRHDFSPVNPDGTDYIKKQDILKTVISPLGSKSEITYKGSTQQNNPKLPINILTVSSIANTEVNKNLVETVKYSYENGKMYFDKNNVYDRRFAGFQKVTTETGTGANIKKTVKYFHQGDGDDASTYERGDSFHNIGRVYKEEVYGGTTKFAETYRTYGVYNWDGQIYKYPKLEVSTEFDASGNTFSKVVQYDYDLAARLPKKTENFGEVKWDITTGTFQDVGEDYVLTKNIYNTKRPQKSLAEESFDINGKFLDKKINFYDELPFGYVEKGLLSEERNYSSANNYVKSTYTYHPTGLVATKTENNGAATSFTYDANYNPTTVTNALGQSETTQYNKVLGVVTSSTNANGKVTNTIYDGFGQVKSVLQTSPKDDTVKLVATKSISYSGNGMTEIESVYNAGAVYKTSTKVYDSFGRLIKSQNTNTENSNQTIDVTYNNLGQMVKVSYPYDGNGLLAGYIGGYDTNYIYDSLGRNVSVSQGDLTNYTDYVVNGKITRDNTPQQHKKEYRYNALGKLSAVREYTGSSYNETKYDWNLLGRLTKLTDAMGNVRNFQYDSEGRLLKQEDLHGATDNTFATYTYTYDVNGNLTSKKDPSGNVATYEYDLLNRPKKESFGVVSNYVYDACQNGVGALCEVNNSDYSQKLKYTKAGNIFTETKNIDDKVFVQMYEYNDLGQNIKIVLPDASYISYTYDVNGKQKSASLTRMINNAASTTQIVTGASYNIDGTVKSYTSGNGVKTCYEYSGTNGGQVLPRLSKINVVNSNDCNSTNLLFGQELTYNLFGSIVENKEKFGPNNFNSGVAGEVLSKYEYDVLQRLTKTDRLENNLNVVNNLSYNSIGNILSSDGAQYSYTGADYQNPHAPSVIGTTQMTYDLNGNILSDNKNQYEWNVKNTLKKVANTKSVSEYTYDVSGERIKEVVKSKSSNSTSTFALNTGTENYVGEEVFTNFADLGTTSIVNLFMSKTAYDEIKVVLGVATVTKQDIASLLLPIQSTKFISETCASIIFSQKENCERDNVLKVIYAKYKKERNLEISYGTLEEIWLVYKNKLKIDGEVYSPRKFKKVLNNTSVDTDVFMEILNVGQPAGYNDYTNTSSVCYVYKMNTSASYTCNFIAKTWEYPKYDNHELESAQFQFLSGNISPANYFQLGSVENINLATTTKFASTTKYTSTATSTTNTWYQGYYVFTADVSTLVKEQIKSSAKPSFKVFGRTGDNGTYYNQMLSAYQPFADPMFKPTLSISYKFTGEFKSFNSTSNKIVTSENVDSYYNSFINNTKVQELVKELPYVSEDTFNELNTNKLAKQNKVEALFAIALEGSKYVKDTCKLPANVGDTNCQKKEAIKFVAGYLYTKHNIKLSANTLEEMYQVYVGNLRMPGSSGAYEKKQLGTLVTAGRTCNTYPSEKNCPIVVNLSTTTGKLYEAVFKYNASGWFGSPFPIELYVNDQMVKEGKILSGQEVINLNPLIKSVNSAAGLNNFKVETRGVVTQWWGMVVTGVLEVKEMAYVNPGNINTQISPSVVASVLNEKVYGTFEQQDKNLLGYVYKQKKIASLFGSDKLISQDSFKELILLPFTYSDLIIRDMLIDVSFLPYESCKTLGNEELERKCRKEKFVKYLFAIVKYEYDRELSATTLDELFEVTEGNLSLPNNTDEYKLRDSKTYDLNSTETTHLLSGYYSYAVNDNYYSQYRTGCQSGSSIPGQLYLYNVCDISFVAPAELQTRKNEIESVKINLLAAQGRGDNNSPGVFNSGGVYMLPVISNNSFSYPGGNIPPSALYAWNTNPGYASPTENIKLGEVTGVNVTNIVGAIVRNEVSNFGIRLISTGHNINYTNAGKYQLTVQYSKDSPQNDAKYLTPLVTNPKDSTVYEHVLQVLARVDKDYKSQINDIISKDAWNEIKNTNIKTNAEVKNIFDINEKLQKDDTLAAVYTYVVANQGINLTRETLEELFMVFESRLSMPEDFKQYDFATATTSKIFYEKASWEVYSQTTSGTKTDYVCNANTTSKCFLKLPDFSKSYLIVNSAILNLQGGGQYNDIRLNSIIEPLATGTNLSTAKLNSDTLSVNYTSPSQKFDLTKIYNSYANNEYGKNGFVIGNNGYSVSGFDLLVNSNHFVEVFTTPNFKVFDRTKLENLSVVPGVLSVRTLADDDFIVDVKMISTETRKELDSVGIKKRQDIYPFITLVSSFGDTSKISRPEKIAYLKNIFDNVKTSKNISLSREALEEIYYVINNKLFFSLEVDTTLQQDNFNRANSSIIGKDWVENYDGGDNLRITDNNLNMVWNNQPWGSFKSVYQNLPQQNDIKITYKWKMAPGATVDGYYPYIGVRSNGGNTYADSYGVALLYIPQVGRIDAHVYNNGTLIKNVTNVVSGPKVNTNYNIEINIDKNNHLEFRIWEEGTTKPTSPSANWNNGGAPFYPSSTGNKITLLTFHGSSAANSANVMMDDFLVSKLTAETNPELSSNTTTFNRTTFPILEPVAGVVSANDLSQTENISYKISSAEIKNISRETVGELSLVGITTKQQILDVFNLTKTLDKDSKISFFKEYFEVQKNYTFSREALEEIYLVYLDKAIFVTNLGTSVAKEITPLTINQNNSPSCYLTVNQWDCNYSFEIKQKTGHRLIKSSLNFKGEVVAPGYGNSYRAVIDINGTTIDAQPILDIFKYLETNMVKTYSGKIRMNVNAWVGINVGVPELELIYEPITATNDRESFGELSSVSTETKLDTSYVEEINSANFNLATTSTSTLWKTSDIALQKLASSTISTVQQIKDLLNSATSTLSKDAKLYHVYKTIKDTKNVELDRLTLEEMWKISLDQQLLQGGTIVSTTQTTVTAPVSLPSELYYKLNGAVGSADKKKDEARGDKPIFVESSVAAVNGRKNDVNGAYQFNSGYVKLPNSVPAITNNPQTYSMWYKGTGGQALFNITSKGTRNFVAVWFYQGKLVPELGWTNGSGYVALIGNKVVTDNVWHKIDMVVENVNSKAVVRLYVDGELDMDSRNQPHNNSTAMNLSSISNEIILGAAENWQSGQMQPGMSGNLDDFKLYNKSLTDTEIRKEYQIDTNTITPTITQTVVDNSPILTAYNRDRYKELSYISPISELERIYNIETGITPPEVFTPSMTEENPNSTPQENLAPTLNTTPTITNTNQILISPETLALLNPNNLGYIPKSETEIELQINGVSYIVNLQNYLQFYTDLETNNINTLAKYLNKLSNLSEEIEYTKFYPSAYYEYDSRGVVTINIPFNGKVVGTYKYQGELSEVSYIHNSYNATPVVITDGNASTTQAIKRSVWGEMLNNNYNENSQVPTEFGLTGHKWDENSALTYSHARYLSNTNKVWLSHDPFSITNFSSDIWLLNPALQNSYNYATQDPVNKVDPDGKLTIVVPGTFYGEGWKTTSNPLFLASMNTFGEIPIFINDPSKWNGGNNNEDRQTAGNYIADIINGHKFAEGEQLNLICHSHGCNASRAAISMMTTDKKVDNFVTLGAPPRSDYYTDMNKVNNMVEVYSRYDWTQMVAGSTIKIKGVIGAWVNQAMGAKTVYSGPDKVYFDGGLLGRYENKNNAVDATVFTTFSTSPSKAHGELWSVASVWNERVQYLVDRPKK